MANDENAVQNHHFGMLGRFTGPGLAAVAAGLGLAAADKPDGWPAVAAAIVGVVGMLVAGYAIAHRPKDPITLLLAALTAVLAGTATNPAWDSIRLMQWVMAGTAAVAAVLVLLPPTGQRVAFSLLVLYHFAGVLSAITSPDPRPWMTGQLWVRLFRPHLEFSYVNNAYQFYSPQPGPAQVLWFCITGTDGESRWYRTPSKSELLDPLGIEYFRRLSLTERANQMSGAGASRDDYLSRMSLVQDYPYVPELMPLTPQYKCPTEQGRHFMGGYAEHAARVLGTGRWNADGTPIPVKEVKVYLTQHDMLRQDQFQKGDDPYAPQTYKPYYMGRFDGTGRPINDKADLAMLYWLVPIIKPENGPLKNTVIMHAGSDPFDPQVQWRMEPRPPTGGNSR
jgi:hypothetical protein